MLKKVSNDALMKEWQLGCNIPTIDNVAAVSQNQSRVGIADAPDIQARMERAVNAVDVAIEVGTSVYGVTTGFGGMAGQHIECGLASQLQDNLLNFLATGAGQPIDSRHTRGAMFLRAHVLLQGKSGVRMELVDRLVRCLNKGLTPIVRDQGSIGASGDLIPLATIARVITGNERSRVSFRGEIIQCREALSHLGLEPLELRPKEGLALVNGTSFSSAIAANATYEAKRLLAISIASQSMLMRAMLVQESPFEDFVHQAKPHPGQMWTARAIRRLLKEGCPAVELSEDRVQDRYSLRCSPQYIGSIVEGMARIQTTVETEMNAVSDNPLIDGQTGAFYQSGNFLGQYVGLAMDDLRKFIGLLAKHLDVQIATLVTPEFNGGLSSSLIGNRELSLNMGLKGLQVCGNSIMPMLTHLASPLVDHYPTHAEQYNQNINGLSWGAANLAWRSVQLYQQYCAVALIFCVQSLDLRAKEVFGQFDGRRLLGRDNRNLYEAIHAVTETAPSDKRPFLYDDADRWLERDIEALALALAGDSALSDAIRPILDSFNVDFQVS